MNLRPLLVTPLFAFFLCASLGCSHWKEMEPESVSVTNRFPGTVAITVDKNQIWSGGGKAFVKGEGVGEHPKEFAQAITNTIKKTQLFTDVVNANGSPDYMLVVHITDVSEPAIGFNMDASMDAKWVLWNKQSQNIWERNIKGSGHAGAGEAFAAMERAQKAVVRSAANNIKLALQSLSAEPPHGGATLAALATG